MKLIAIYTNGNYRVSLYDDGTKVRETIDENDTEFISEFPESIDLKITNQCDLNCPMCHEDSCIDGKHGNINEEFLKTIPAYTEVAIGGGNPLAHPNLIQLLELFKKNEVIANMTINQKHFMKYPEVIETLLNKKLIHGLGISFTHYDEKFINKIQKYDNIVLHIIAGLQDPFTLRSLYKKNLKLLILGYKVFRRGKALYDDFDNQIKILYNIDRMAKDLPEIFNNFKVVSFDNLAIKQLKLKDKLVEEAWNEFYQGDDGSHTFYVDLVNREFARNSTSLQRFPISDDITDMFKRIKIYNI